MSTSAGGSATSREAPTRSGSCRSSSSTLGSWELAAEHAARARDIAFQYGIEIPQHHLPIAWIAVHRGQLDLARETSTAGTRPRARQQLGLHPPYHLAVIGLVALWGGDASTGAEWLGRAHSRALELGWFESDQSPVDRRLRRGAARARPDRRGRGSPRHVGSRREATRTTEESSRTSCGVGAKSQPRAEISTRQCGSSTTRLLVTRRSAILTAGPVPSSPSASFAGAHGRSVRARDAISRGARRIRAARRGRPGSSEHVGARKHRRPHARGRPDPGRATRCGSRRRGPDEPRGRCRACSSASARLRAT